jgi:hypothetical protein
MGNAAFVLLAVAGCALAACGGVDQRSGSHLSTARWPPAIAKAEMSTVAGGGKQLGDGGPASRAGFCLPVDLAGDAAGNLFIATRGSSATVPAGTRSAGRVLLAPDTGTAARRREVLLCATRSTLTAARGGAPFVRSGTLTPDPAYARWRA